MHSTVVHDDDDDWPCTRQHCLHNSNTAKLKGKPRKTNYDKNQNRKMVRKNASAAKELQKFRELAGAQAEVGVGVPTPATPTPQRSLPASASCGKGGKNSMLPASKKYVPTASVCVCEQRFIMLYISWMCRGAVPDCVCVRVSLENCNNNKTHTRTPIHTCTKGAHHNGWQKVGLSL